MSARQITIPAFSRPVESADAVNGVSPNCYEKEFPMMKCLFSFAKYLVLGAGLLAGGSLPAQDASAPPDTGPNAGFQTIHNDFYWVDQNGARINTRSGCLCQFNGVYYWYGGTARFHDQTCYASTDLVHWTFKGVILHLDVDANRIDMLYNEATKQYVMFLKYNGNGAFFAHCHVRDA